MTSFLRTLFVTFVLCGLVLLGFWHVTSDRQAQAIKELETLNNQMQERLAARQAMIERLSRSRRIAHLQITDQKKDDTGKINQTDVQFIELDDSGTELARQKFSIPGEVLFVDAWTVKFDPERVAVGDPLLGKTLVLLRRIYSDQQAPQDGQLIDTPGAVPPGYACGEVGRFEKALWENFWLIATDAKKASDMGVRVAQGEAVYKPVRAGQTYELIVDAAGGMNLTPLAEEHPTLTKAPD